MIGHWSQRFYDLRHCYIWISLTKTFQQTPILSQFDVVCSTVLAKQSRRTFQEGAQNDWSWRCTMVIYFSSLERGSHIWNIKESLLMQQSSIHPLPILSKNTPCPPWWTGWRSSWGRGSQILKKIIMGWQLPICTNLSKIWSSSFKNIKLEIKKP